MEEWFYVLWRVAFRDLRQASQSMQLSIINLNTPVQVNFGAAEAMMIMIDIMAQHRSVIELIY